MDEKDFFVQVQPGETIKQLESLMESAGIKLNLTENLIPDINSPSQRDEDNSLANENPMPETEVTDQKCVAPGCSNTKFTAPDKGYYKFPNKKKTFSRWLAYCKRLSMMLGRSEFRRQDDSTLCGAHFKRNQFYKNGYLLKKTAVPTVYPQLNTKSATIGDNIASGSSSSGLTMNQKSLKEGAGERVCRVCASQFKNLIPIFNETGIKNCIPHMIDACLPIMVEKTDLWPKYICEGCLLVLKQSYALQEQSMDAEKKFGLPMIDINECFYASQQPIVDHTSTGGGLFELGEPSTRLGPITDSELNLTALQTESHSLSLQPGNFHENLPTNEELTIGDELCNFADLGSLTNDFMFDLGTFLETSGVQPLETLGQCPINIGNVVEFDGPETSSHVANVNYSCGACGKGFCTLEALDDHMKFHPLVQLYKCRICQFECLTRDLMETHIMVHYSALKPEILVDLKCHRCGIEYKSKKRYYSHKCLRPDSKKYGCKLCSKYFLLENRLDLHMKYQHGDKPGRCDICRKRFRTEVTLFQHYEKKHERVVPYVCNDCGLVFESPVYLRQHREFSLCAGPPNPTI